MFHNLLKVFHDGIILTVGPEVVYQNRQVEQIFEIRQAEEINELDDNPEDEDPESGHNNVSAQEMRTSKERMALVEAMKHAKHCSGTGSNSNSS
jgi:hypothetical protein